MQLDIHLKIDTGMSRLGFFADDREETVPELIELAALPGLRTTGIFMHFAVSDTPDEEDYTQLQHNTPPCLVSRQHRNTR